MPRTASGIANYCSDSRGVKPTLILLAFVRSFQSAHFNAPQRDWRFVTRKQNPTWKCAPVLHQVWPLDLHCFIAPFRRPKGTTTFTTRGCRKLTSLNSYWAGPQTPVPLSYVSKGWDIHPLVKGRGEGQTATLTRVAASRLRPASESNEEEEE